MLNKLCYLRRFITSSSRQSSLYTLCPWNSLWNVAAIALCSSELIHFLWGFVVIVTIFFTGESIYSKWLTSKIKIYQEFSYRRGDYLIFGSETSGLPQEALQDCKSEAYGGGTIRIPMVETYVRCLNLSVSVGIALYEACRQLNYEHLQFPSNHCVNNEQSFITEDIFA